MTSIHQVGTKATTRRRWRTAGAAATASALVVALAACGNNAGAKGSTGDFVDGQFVVDTKACPAEATTALSDGAPIKVGTVLPLSGQFVAIGKPLKVGLETYFAKVNAEGGIDGHKLELVAKDDQFDPTKTVPAVTEMIQKDQVFTTLLQAGTPNVAAAQPLAEQNCVPQLWAATGAPQFTDAANHPWTSMGFMSYATEAQILGDFIKKEKPGAKVAYLEVDTDTGKAYSTKFEEVAKDDGFTIVGSQKVAPTAASVDNEVTSLLALKPDVIVLMSLSTLCAKAIGALRQGGYEGQVIAAYTCAAPVVFPTLGKAADGIDTVGISQLLAAADNADIDQFEADLAEYGDGTEPNNDSLTAYRIADVLVQNLRAAADLKGGLTRANLMNAAWNFDGELFAAWAPRAKLEGDKDANLFETAQMLQWDGGAGALVPTGDVIDLEGKSDRFGQ